MAHWEDMRPGHVGGPTPYTCLRLADWEEGGYSVKDEPFPRGEVLVGGGTVSKGYFIPDNMKDTPDGIALSKKTKKNSWKWTAYASSERETLVSFVRTALCRLSIEKKICGRDLKVLYTKNDPSTKVSTLPSLKSSPSSRRCPVWTEA